MAVGITWNSIFCLEKITARCLVTSGPSETLGKEWTFQKHLKSNISHAVIKRISRGRKNQSPRVLKCNHFSVSKLFPRKTAKYSEFPFPLKFFEIYRSLAW